jgi:serralysin
VGLIFRYMVACLALSILAATPGRASFIAWEVNEVFSNADGTIQFVEFFEAIGQDGQRSFDGKQLKTFVAGASPNDPLTTHTFNSDLPSDLTAYRFALVATQGFASLPGAVEPDFVMPDGFIDTSVVVEIELGNIDEFVFRLGAIPVDGVNSLYRVGRPINPNSPTNFAGQTGSIDVPEPAAAAQAAAALACLLTLRWWSARRPRRGEALAAPRP